MRRLAALLRAVNVGGRKVLMEDLKRVAGDAGFEAPATLLASGNLLFGTLKSPADAASALESAILREIGVATDVLVRDRAELEEVLAANPFTSQAHEQPGFMHVMFVTGEPQGDPDTLTAVFGGGEEMRAGPGCLYIWYPQGAGTSKLTGGLIERRLKLRGTMRNWNTVRKLAAALDR